MFQVQAFQVSSLPIRPLRLFASSYIIMKGTCLIFLPVEMDLAGAILHLFRCQGGHVSELVAGCYHRRNF